MSNKIMNCLVKLELRMIWNRTCRLTLDSQLLLERMKYLKHQLLIMTKDTMSVCCGLMTTSNSQTNTSSLVQLKSLEKRLSRDTIFKENYAKTISEYQEKAYIIRVLMPTWSKSGQIKNFTYHIIR